ncbi:hypothetical protein POP12_055 [Pectobacterium phage POP12]|nr:hypothetical protein POP12_055 [Pectobacterium phage POP12]
MNNFNIFLNKNTRNSSSMYIDSVQIKSVICANSFKEIFNQIGWSQTCEDTKFLWRRLYNFKKFVDKNSSIDDIEIVSIFEVDGDFYFVVCCKDHNSPVEDDHKLFVSKTKNGRCKNIEINSYSLKKQKDGKMISFYTYEIENSVQKKNKISIEKEISRTEKEIEKLKEKVKNLRKNLAIFD